MTLRFTKMHALGNDFMIIDGINQDIQQLPAEALSNRHTGVGFDQLLIIKRSENAEFFCRIYNSDGSEAEQCGNGLRCVARYVHEHGLTKEISFSIETISGIYPVDIHSYDNISILMGAPTIVEKSVNLQLENNDFVNDVTVLTVGNPHAIVRVSEIDTMQIDILGDQISKHAQFPNGTNVGFMEVMSSQHIKLRTFERGAAETHACGSNACAAVVAGITRGWLDSEAIIEVEFRYGRLSVCWNENGQPIQLSGPAVYVFDGTVNLD